jgi:hypothetical protein
MFKIYLIKCKTVSSAFFRTSVVVILSLFGCNCFAQLVGDLRSTGTGNWNATATWERYDGAIWEASGTGANNPGQLPNATTSVFIQSTHTVTIAGNEACLDVNIAKGNKTTATALGKIALGVNTLSVFGILRNYLNDVGVIDPLGILPPLFTPDDAVGYNVYPFTGTTGKVSIEGFSRPLTNAGQWDGTISNASVGIFPLEINVNSGEAVALGTGIKVSSLVINTGTLDANLNRIGVGNGTSGVGDVTINVNGTLSSANTSAGNPVISQTASLSSGNFNLYGKFLLTGTSPYIEFASITFHPGSIVEFSRSTNPAAHNLLQKSFGASVAIPTTYQNLVKSGNKILNVNTSISIKESLTISAGTLALGASDVTILSSATNTANITAVSGLITYGGAGRFVVERYLFGKRAWRLLAAPVDQVSSPSILNSWQEAGSLIPTGYGTQVSGPAGGTGLDYTTVRGSLKWFDTSAQTYVEITNTNNAIARTEGYYVFVRGDRAQGLSGTGLATNLRIRGKILTGTQPDIALGALHFASVGNPYPSAIDFRNVFKSNMVDAFIAWNPNSAGSYNLGAFETYVYNVGAGHYFRTPGGQIRDSIQSGEAVFVQTFTGGGILRFEENDKVGGSRNVSRESKMIAREGIIVPTLDIDLYTKDVNGTSFLADGVQLNFGNSYSNAVDNDDVRKISNTADNVSITNKGTKLVVERRHTLQNTDTIFLNLSNTRIATYRFEIDPSVLDNTGLNAFLKDKFLQIETPISLSTVTKVNFDITADAASRVADRFMIVFRQAASLNFTTISAERNADKTITVKWGTQQEVGVVNYELQHSNDGINFINVDTQLPLANNGTNPTYSKQHATATKNNNWYRVKASMVNGTSKYSAIAMVGALVDVAVEPSIAIYPNPVENKLIKIHFAGHAGKYAVSLLNEAGKMVYTENMVVVSNNETQTIGIKKSFAAGNYSVLFVAEDGTKKIIKMILL